MSSRLIIDGNAVYEIDEECINNGEQKPAKRAREFKNLKKQENIESPEKERS